MTTLRNLIQRVTPSRFDLGGQKNDLHPIGHPPGKSPGQEQDAEPGGLGQRLLRSLPWMLIGLFFVWSLLSADPEEEAAAEFTYSGFIEAVDEGRVTSAKVLPDGAVSGELTNGETYESRIPVGLAGEEFLNRLEAASVSVEAVADTPGFLETLLGALFAFLPILVIIAFWVYISRRARGAMAGTLGIGKSKAKVFDSSRPSTTFDDVAGYAGVKREIMEIADFVRDPTRYLRAGAKAPRGILMTGPPGTGKTLVARALAGEVGVPFLSVTGSSFVEMFVGVGAARVRDLFQEARKVAPAVIFVDEIDAIGQRRQAGAMMSNEEREQTLNQLLAEMDGFDPSTGIIVLAATNRPEVLDAALLRPGRFDRQVTIPLPNQDERTAILAVHCKGKRLSAEMNLADTARATPGFSGADLANLVNEAAIRAARQDRQEITAEDIEQARDRILLGQRDGSTVLLPEERRAVAAHESGHALVAAHCQHADPIHKVTILPTGRALGVTQQLPEHERHLYSEQFLYDTLAVQLGGRAAELVVFDQASTGAANDLATATNIAIKMVKEYGLTRAVGPVGYSSGGPMFLGRDGLVESRPYADETQRAIDVEVGRILSEAQQRAIDIVSTHRDQLDQLIARLAADETISGDDVYQITGRPPPTSRPQILSNGHRATHLNR